jgi:hypothetical protein
MKGKNKNQKCERKKKQGIGLPHTGPAHALARIQ